MQDQKLFIREYVREIWASEYFLKNENDDIESTNMKIGSLILLGIFIDIITKSQSGNYIYFREFRKEEDLIWST